MVLRVGQDVGSYRLVAEISRGDYASVYQATHHILTNRLVALKLLHTAKLPVQSNQEDFFREARILTALQHPHILPLIDADLYEGQLYIITEFASNGSLRKRLNRQPASPLSLEEALTILEQIGQALHFAHQQNIVHCDVKPENILFNANNQAVMADFDIARVLSSATTPANSLGGTSAYMAPEQLQGKVRKESDQYSLGCVAYELFTGHQPFRGQDQVALRQVHLAEKPVPPTQINSALPQHYDVVILKAMAKKYSERYKDIPAFLEALRAASVPNGMPHLWLPLILKGEVSSKDEDSAIYYEKTELNLPEDEKVVVARSEVKKRRVTKPVMGGTSTTSRKVSAVSAKTEEKQRSVVKKKPVKSITTKSVVSKASVEEEVVPEKKVSVRKGATPTRKKAADTDKPELLEVKKPARKSPLKKKERASIVVESVPVVKQSRVPERSGVKKAAATGVHHAVKKVKES